MPTQVRFRRGTTAQNNNFTGASGEITVNTSNNTIRVHDGTTLGGTELATVTHVTNSIANVIDSAPQLLDTLNELAAAIGDDPGFYANVASLGGSALQRANAAYDRANVGVTYAGAAFDKANTLVATVAGVSSTSISNTNLLDGIKTVDGSSSGLDSDLLDGQDGSYYLDWTNTTNKPDPVITVSLTGNVTGSASATLVDLASNSLTISTNLVASGVSASTYGGSSKVPVFTVDSAGRITSAANVNVAGVTSFGASGNTFTISTADGGSFSASIQENSVRLGTDTTGDYLSNVVPGTGLVGSNFGTEGATPTLSLAASGVAASSYGNAATIPTYTVDTYGRLTSAANVAISIPSSALNTDVALGTQTSGAYVANLIAGTGVSLIGLANEGATPTIAIGQAVNTNSDVTFANVTVTGNLLVQGNAIEFSANTLVINDPLIQVGKNPAGDAVDLGFFGHYIGGSPSIERHAGLFRDATDGQFKLFTNLDPEPATIVDTANATYQSANLVVNFVVGKVTDISNHSTSGLSEGSNLYFTNARSRASLTGGTGISYDSSAGTITLSTSGVTAATYGGSSTVPVYTVDTYGRLTSASNVSIAISSGAVSGLAASATTDTTSASNISSGTLPSARLSGSYSGITGVGTITAGTWNGTSISTTYTDAKVTSVNGSTGAVSGLATTAGTLAQFGATTSSQLAGVISDETGTGLLVFNNAPTLDGNVTCTGNVNVSYFVTSPYFYSYSDRNLKTDIATIPGALDKLNKLNGVSFKWIRDNKDSLGLIAQDVQTVLPQAVEHVNNSLTVNYNGVVALLVEAIKEQQKQIDELKVRLDNVK